jgi:hypothetical protein
MMPGVAIAACHEKPQPDPVPVVSSVTPVAPVAPSFASEPTASQTWRGQYNAVSVRLSVEPEAANEKAWKHESTRLTGTGSIEIHIDGKGEAHGSAEGPLGDVVLRGQLENELLSLTITPLDDSDPFAFAGTAALKKVDSSKLEGTLKVSTSDSFTLRRAALSLTRLP